MSVEASSIAPASRGSRRFSGSSRPSRCSLRTELVIFDAETHLSVVPAAISRGLRWLLRE
ncbi:MAG TPA: hypothetical protein VMT85_11525 [Thermoanaerobaculia bacterium]|nr:hypothetical protein [Thermoanaerobaculia bacterium]